MASTSTGEFLVASEDGKIRLYNDHTKQAKTLLPGTGETIIGVDTTQSGKYVLATLKSAILVIPTERPDGETGFRKRMGKDKPKPRRLALRQTDIVKYGLRGQSFTKATFNNGETRHDKIITTSIGRYVVTWSLRSIRHGDLDDYEIKEESEKVTFSQARYNCDSELLVTMPDKVAIERRRRRH